MKVAEMEICIPVERYTELIRAERDADHLKEFLCSKLKSYGGISHNELEMLRALGFIRGCENDTDS